MTKQTLTPQEKEQRIKVLAKIPVKTFDTYTAEQMRKELKGLAKNLRGTHKPQLMELFLEVTKLERDRLNAELENTVINDKSSSDCIKPESLKNYFEEGLRGKDTAIVIFKNAETLNLKPTTIAKTWSKTIKRNLDYLVSKNFVAPEWANECFNSFKEQVKPLHHEYNQAYNAIQQLSTPVDEKITLDSEKILNWASETLHNPNPKKWGLISLALAITSGRRMDEIHGTCKFEIVDSNHIKAIGLSKKPNDDSEFVFQTLVEANVWLQAYNLIPSDKKGHPYEIVNNIIRKTIENHSREVTLNIFGQGASYKWARDFYALYMLNNFYVGGLEDTIKYMRDILGHESTKQTLSYTKFTLKKQS